MASSPVPMTMPEGCPLNDEDQGSVWRPGTVLFILSCAYAGGYNVLQPVKCTWDVHEHSQRIVGVQRGAIC